MYRIHELCFRAGVSAILATLALSNVPPVMAQSTPAPEWSVVVVSTIKPECRSDYELWQKEMSAAYKKAEVPSRAVLQTVMGNLMEYTSVTPLVHFADLEGLTPVERALGKEDAAALMRKGSAFVTSVQRFASRAPADMGIHTKLSEQAEYALIASMHLLPGKGPDFDAWMKNEYLPALKKADVKNYWANETMFGGDATERVTVRLMKKIGDLDAGPLLDKVLGEEGARKMVMKRTGMIDSVHLSVVRYRTDLSYNLASPGMQTTASAK